MVFVTIDFHTLHDFVHLTIDTDIEVALATHGLEEFAIMTLTSMNQWCQEDNLLALVVVKNHLDNTLFGVLYHLFARSVTVCSAGTGKEQAHVVVNLGGGAYGGARILIGSLLFDADDRRKTRNLVDIRPLHSAQEVAGIGRECLDIAALALSKNSVESQR